MKNLKKTVNQFNVLVQQLKFEEALNKFYDENAVSVENEETPTVGFVALHEASKSFLNECQNLSAEIVNTIVSEDIDLSVTEWHYKFTHPHIGIFDSNQLSVQRWKNGKIIHERHNHI
jgi:hypothetical protein